MNGQFTDLYWVEKYRPSTLNDVILSEEEKSKFQNFITLGECPHLLLVGPPGTGKSTVGRILVNGICPDRYDHITTNGSSERGIDFVRNTVVDFMKAPPRNSKIKIIMVDEADGLTDEAFAALRNTIEDPRTNQLLMTRFVFTANAIQKIPDYIISRMQVNEFTQPDINLVKQRCLFVLQNEHVTFEESTVDSVIKAMYPDVRSIIGELQNSVTNGVLISRPIFNSLESVKEKIDAVFMSTNLDQAAVARLALRDVLPDDFQAVDIAKYVMDRYSDDALIHSIAYRYHIIAFRSYDQKHTVLAMLGDYLLAKFGFGM